MSLRGRRSHLEEPDSPSGTICVFQGISIRPIVEYINIRRTNKKLNTINVEIHGRVSHLTGPLETPSPRFFTSSCLLPDDGTRGLWDRGLVWTMEPLLLERQVGPV